MSDVINTDRALYLECKNLAIEIFEEFLDKHGRDFDPEQYSDEMSDRAHEMADGHEAVIYNYRAIQICANCDTTLGEEFVEDTGLPENPTFESIACAIAYGQMRGQIEQELQEIVEAWESEDWTEYDVSQHFIPALINDDWSELTIPENKALEWFVLTEAGNIATFHWSTDGGDGYFATCEVTGIKATCETVKLVNMDIVQANRELLTPEHDEKPTPLRAALNIAFDLRRAICDLEGWTPRDAELLLAGPLSRLQAELKLETELKEES